MSKFFNYLKAGYPCLWVETYEEDRCIASLSQKARMYEVFSWDLDIGFTTHEGNTYESMPDPLGPLKKIMEIPETSIVFLKDYHKFLPSVDVFRAIKNLTSHMKAKDKHLVIVSPVTDIPVELEKDITVFEFDLPSVEDLMAIATRMVRDNELDIDVDKQAIAAGKGLTLNEAENAMAYSIISTGKFSREVMEEAKLQAVRKSGLMELYMPEPESSLGGLDNLKQYLHNRKKGFSDNALPTPKGILLAGPPGAGKSLSAKVTASVFRFPLLKLDLSSLKGSLVGESEKKMRQATQLADAIGECVLFIDEIEKSLGGVQSSNQTDGGSTAGMFGHLLTWMQETKSKAYIVATCNDVSELLNISQGALLRRFDDVFFVDIPAESERKTILNIMNRRYGTDIDVAMVSEMKNWTGAEIEKFVKASVYDGEEEAFRNIHPIFDQNRGNIEEVRTWAKTNARLANTVDPAESNEQVRRLKVS